MKAWVNENPPKILSFCRKLPFIYHDTGEAGSLPTWKSIPQNLPPSLNIFSDIWTKLNELLFSCIARWSFTSPFQYDLPLTSDLGTCGHARSELCYDKSWVIVIFAWNTVICETPYPQMLPVDFHNEEAVLHFSFPFQTMNQSFFLCMYVCIYDPCVSWLRVLGMGLAFSVWPTEGCWQSGCPVGGILLLLPSGCNDKMEPRKLPGNWL